jgi:hypothetical protein
MTTTLDPAHITNLVGTGSLSNGNLTLSSTGLSIATSTAAATGKQTFEITTNTDAFGGAYVCSDSSASDGFFVSWSGSNWVIYKNSDNSEFLIGPSSPSPSTTQIITVDPDVAGKKVSVRINGTSIFSNANVTSVAPTAWKVGVVAGDASVVGTTFTSSIKFSSLTYAPLSGYSEWDSSGGTAYTLSAAAGSYAITGTAALLKRSRRVVASAGSYAFTGSTAVVRKGYKATSGTGSYSVSGSSTTLRKASRLPVQSGSYAMNGSPVGTERGLKVSAGSSSYSLAGFDASFTRTYILGAESASYDLTGPDVGFSRSYVLKPQAAQYELTGSDVSLTKLSNKTLSADTASYAFNGSNISLTRSYRIDFDEGQYDFSGTDAGLILAENKQILVDAGSYYFTGTTASPLRGLNLSTLSASYSISGSSSLLKRDAFVLAGFGSYALTGNDASLTKTGHLSLPADAGSYSFTGSSSSLTQVRKLISESGIYVLTGSAASLIRAGSSDYTLSASPGSYLLSGQDIELIYTPIIGVRNPLERLKMYTGSMGSVSNREDWIVNISLVGDDGASFDLTGSEIVAFVCREGCSNNPVLSASVGNGIVLTDNYTMQWHFSEEQMASLCPQQYDVFCRVERDAITTQILSANVAIVEGGPS